MSAPTTVDITGTILTPDADPITYQPPEVTNSNLVGQSYSLALSSTPVTITLPANTVFIGLRMPALNTVPVTLKGISGDAGISVHPTLGIPCLPLASTQTTVVLVAASNVTVQFVSG